MDFEKNTNKQFEGKNFLQQKLKEVELIINRISDIKLEKETDPNLTAAQIEAVLAELDEARNIDLLELTKEVIKKDIKLPKLKKLNEKLYNLLKPFYIQIEAQKKGQIRQAYESAQIQNQGVNIADEEVANTNSEETDTHTQTSLDTNLSEIANHLPPESLNKIPTDSSKPEQFAQYQDLGFEPEQIQKLDVEYRQRTMVGSEYFKLTTEIKLAHDTNLSHISYFDTKYVTITNNNGDILFKKTYNSDNNPDQKNFTSYKKVIDQLIKNYLGEVERQKQQNIHSELFNKFYKELELNEENSESRKQITYYKLDPKNPSEETEVKRKKMTREPSSWQKLETSEWVEVPAEYRTIKVKVDRFNLIECTSDDQDKIGVTYPDLETFDQEHKTKFVREHKLSEYSGDLNNLNISILKPDFSQNTLHDIANTMASRYSDSKYAKWKRELESSWISKHKELVVKAIQSKLLQEIYALINNEQEIQDKVFDPGGRQKVLQEIQTQKAADKTEQERLNQVKNIQNQKEEAMNQLVSEGILTIWDVSHWYKKKYHISVLNTQPEVTGSPNFTKRLFLGTDEKYIDGFRTRDIVLKLNEGNSKGTIKLGKDYEGKNAFYREFDTNSSEGFDKFRQAVITQHQQESERLQKVKEINQMLADKCMLRYEQAKSKYPKYYTLLEDKHHNHDFKVYNCFAYDENHLKFIDAVANYQINGVKLDKSLKNFLYKCVKESYNKNLHTQINEFIAEAGLTQEFEAKKAELKKDSKPKLKKKS
ncbi:MAG: hypothetical protein AAGF07_01705 [Patescibacteria group bacterium]